MERLCLMFLDHTQRRSTVGRTHLDEWSARPRDLYLTTHDTHNRQISMSPVGFEPTISAGERPQAAGLRIVLFKLVTRDLGKFLLYMSSVLAVSNNECSYVEHEWIWHSEDRASWYILIIKANKMHYFSDLFDKVLYMFRTYPLSIIRSTSTLYTRNRYLSC